MGQSTNGQLCYGVVFNDGYEFPWDAEPYEGDIDDWRLAENGWTPKNEYPYNDEGYKPRFSKTDPRVDAYHKERREWLKANPMPVMEVNYCSGDYPMMILAVPETMRTAWRGDPVAIAVTGLDAHPEGEKQLLEFCEKYKLEFVGRAEWWLSSYWG